MTSPRLKARDLPAELDLRSARLREKAEVCIDGLCVSATSPFIIAALLIQAHNKPVTMRIEVEALSKDDLSAPVALGTHKTEAQCATTLLQMTYVNMLLIIDVTLRIPVSLS